MSAPVSVRMPKLNMAATHATFVEWLVADGARVEAEEPLYVCTSDKADVEVPSPAAGVLRHGEVVPDEVYPVGTTLGEIEPS